jgi:hypothetical protein
VSARNRLRRSSPPCPTARLTAAPRHAKALQDSLVNLFNRIEAVKEEHDKLDNNNRFLQKYIGDLMSTSKITSSSSRSKK